MSYDVYVKKLLVEKMIDGYTAGKKSAGETGKKSEEAAKGEDAKKEGKEGKEGWRKPKGQALRNLRRTSRHNHVY